MGSVQRCKNTFLMAQELFDYAKKIKIKCFSTPFDLNALNLLEKLNCPIYKIASFEATDLELIKEVSMPEANDNIYRPL